MTQAPLTFSLTEFPEGPTQRNDVLPAEDLYLGDAGMTVQSPVEISLEITRTRGALHIRGQAALRIRLACIRCLEESETVLQAAVSVLVRPRDPRGGSAEEAPRGVLYYNGEIFSLADEVRQSVLLEIPPNPLCSPDCKGLCPRCGANLNKGGCGCSASAAGDPRWAALHSLHRGRAAEGVDVNGESAGSSG